MGKKYYFLILLALVALFIVPITATPVPSGTFLNAETTTSDQTTSYVYSADPGYALGNIVIELQPDTSSSFTLTYGNGSTVSGTAVYTTLNLVYSRSVVSIGGDSQTREFVDAHLSQTQMKITGYAKDEAAGTTGFGIWDSALGLWSDQIAYFAVPNGANRLISSVSVTSDKPVKVTVSYGKSEEIAAANNKNALDILNEWVQFAISLGGLMIGVITNIVWWMKFFFIDNLLLEVVLYLAVTMAVSAIQSVRSKGFDIFRFYKKFIGYQVALYRFVIDMWTQLVTIVSWFAQIFKLV